MPNENAIGLLAAVLLPKVPAELLDVVDPNDGVDPPNEKAGALFVAVLSACVAGDAPKEKDGAGFAAPSLDSDADGAPNAKDEVGLAVCIDAEAVVLSAESPPWSSSASLSSSSSSSSFPKLAKKPVFGTANVGCPGRRVLCAEAELVEGAVNEEPPKEKPLTGGLGRVGAAEAATFSDVADVLDAAEGRDGVVAGFENEKGAAVLVELVWPFVSVVDDAGADVLPTASFAAFVVALSAGEIGAAVGCFIAFLVSASFRKVSYFDETAFSSAPRSLKGSFFSSESSEETICVRSDSLIPRRLL